MPDSPSERTVFPSNAQQDATKLGVSKRPVGVGVPRRRRRRQIMIRGGTPHTPDPSPAGVSRFLSRRDDDHTGYRNAVPMRKQTRRRESPRDQGACVCVRSRRCERSAQVCGAGASEGVNKTENWGGGALASILRFAPCRRRFTLAQRVKSGTVVCVCVPTGEHSFFSRRTRRIGGCGAQRALRRTTTRTTHARLGSEQTFSSTSDASTSGTEGRTR